jgi:hypothetical protein
MNRSETIGKLAEALAAAQAEMHPAEENSVNPFLKNRYADLGSIIEAIRQPFGKHGLAFIQCPTFDDMTVTVETTIIHTSGEWVASSLALSMEGEKGLSLAQVLGKGITYLSRYGLRAMSGVYAGEDEDGNDSGRKVAPARQTPQAARSLPVPTETAADAAFAALPSASVNLPPAAPKPAQPIGPNVSDPNPPAVAQPAKAAKVAVIKTKLFFDLAADLAKQHPYYRNKNGDADTAHMCASLAQKLGIDAITETNVMEAMNLLADHATQHEATAPSGK